MKTPIMVGALVAALTPALAAQEPADEASWEESAAEFERTLDYREGVVELGDGIATIQTPSGFRFLGPDDAQRLIEIGWGNPPGEAPLGMLVSTSGSPLSEEGWGIIITFEDGGYVEDDDAETIDYAQLLTEMQQSVREENKERRAAGYAGLELVGWAAPPRYDRASHKLHWAKELAFDGEPEHTLNYNIRVLGRRGVLVLNAVASIRQLEAVQADVAPVLDAVDFNQGHRYADFIPGTDKVAAYGIAGLIAGKIAVKAGLFKLLLAALVAAKKLVVVAVVAVGAFLRRLFGGKREQVAGAAE